EKAYSFFRLAKLEDALSEFNELANRVVDKKGSTLDRFVEIIVRKGQLSFLGLEKVNGTWKDRLRHLWDNKYVRVDNMELDVSALIARNSEHLVDLQTALRGTSGRELLLNELRDIICFMILRERIYARSDRADFVHVRFYTEMRDVLRNGFVREYLS